MATNSKADQEQAAWTTNANISCGNGYVHAQEGGE